MSGSKTVAQTALLTGASSGIGEALAEVFAENGWNLVLVARRRQRLDEISERLVRVYGIQATVIAMDIGNANAARALYDEVRSRNLEIDCLVNNAGRGHFGAFLDGDWQQDDGTIELNVNALTALCHLFAGPMADRSLGYILNVASLAGFMPGPNFAVYHATKAFVLSLSRALNAELAEKGIRVTASCPGPTATEFFDHADTDSVKALEMVPMMRSEKVAQQAYDALMKGQATVVHGVSNSLMAQAPRLIPTNWLAPLVKMVMR